MKRRISLIGFAVLLVSALTLTGTSFAAGSPSNPQISVLFCTLFVEFDAPAAGVEYNVQIWDDGALIFNPIRTSTSPGETLVFSFDFFDREIGQIAPGIGIIIYADGAFTYINDPYTDLDAGCLAFQSNQPGCDVLAPLPKTAVVASFVHTAPLYWAPGEPVTPSLSIEAGKTAWAIGPDATGEYYKILWVCDFLWVPTAALGPNFDNVWQGTPLPNAPVS